MVRMLFRPFDASRWLVVGFTAWLALLGESGPASSFQFNSGGGNGDTPPDEMWATAKTFVQENLEMVVGITAIVMLAGIILSVIILWINSRGKFMFLDNVARDRAEISEPWKNFRHEAHALFWWRFVFGLLVTVVVGVLIALGLLTLWPVFEGGPFNVRIITSLSGLIALLLAVAFIAGLVTTYLVDFVVPLMYRWNLTCRKGWSVFAPLFRAHCWAFIGYALLKWLVEGVLSFVATLVILFACCCFCIGIVFFIPYIGTVMLLPLFVFYRNFGLFFLAQFGSEYVCFSSGESEELRTEDTAL
jgi:hypothetical protein